MDTLHTLEPPAVKLAKFNDTPTDTADGANMLSTLSRLRQLSDPPPRHADAGTPLRQRRRGAGTDTVRARAASMNPLAALGLLSDIGERLGSAVDVADALGVAVRMVRAITRFDRVVALRFDERWAGEALAESMDTARAQPAYLGLQFAGIDVLANPPEINAIS